VLAVAVVDVVDHVEAEVVVVEVVVAGDEVVDVGSKLVVLDGVMARRHSQTRDCTELWRMRLFMVWSKETAASRHRSGIGHDGQSGCAILFPREILEVTL
jgi:hypothetical protein